MAKRGRTPKHYETWDKKELIVGLRRDKKSGRFYPVGRGSPSFGTDESSAIHRFKSWQAQKGKKPKPKIPVKMSSTIHALDELVNGRVPEWTWSPGEFSTDLEILKNAWRREVRSLIFSNPKKAAVELDCEPIALLANVEDLKPPPPSKSLQELCSTYLEDRLLTEKEAANSRTWWSELCKITGAKVVDDLDRESFRIYRKTIRDRRGNRSSVWIRSRFGKIKTIIRQALVEVDLTDKEKAALAYVAMLTLPAKPRPHPVDISPKELRAILAEADDWDSALILVGLNAAYLPIDCQRLEWSMIDWKAKFIRFDRSKPEHLTEQALPRICAVWTRTIKALRAIRNEHDHVFVSDQGKPAHIDTVNDRFVRCRQRAKIKRNLTFKHLRKSALTAASNDPKVPDRQIELLAGHSAGIKEHYVVKKNVQLACEAIERYYFGKRS